MPTVSLIYKNNFKLGKRPKNQSEYYLKLIIKQTLECLNSNCISYVTNKNFSQKAKIDANIVLSPNMSSNLIFSNLKGIQVFFTPGNPKSKRLAKIMAENLKNIYYDPPSVRIHPKEKINLNETYVYLQLGQNNSKEDNIWLRGNTEEISQNIIMSLTEYFGLPFVACIKPLRGFAISDSDVFSKPNTKSKIIGHITKNKKTKINGQWENWYIIGQNHDLGYVPSKFIDII